MRDGGTPVRNAHAAVHRHRGLDETARGTRSGGVRRRARRSTGGSCAPRSARHGGTRSTRGGCLLRCLRRSRRAAVAAAAEAQEALANGPISGSDGLAHRRGRRDREGYVGRDVHLAARVMPPGTAGRSRSRGDARACRGHELRDLGEHRLKDFDEPVRCSSSGRSVSAAEDDLEHKSAAAGELVRRAGP